MRAKSLLLIALSGVVFGAVVPACSGGDDDKDKKVKFVDAEAPEPQLRYPADGEVVTGVIFVSVIDASLMGENEYEIPRLRESLVSAEYSTNGGTSWVLIDENVPLALPYEPDTLGWDTSNVNPGPGREALFRVTITDEEARTGTREVSLTINKAPEVTGILIEEIDFGGADPVFTLTAEAYDPDNETAPLLYEWHFQWDDSVATGATVMKTVPTLLLETGSPLVATLHVTDSDLGHTEGVGTLTVPTNGTPAYTEAPNYCTCEPTPGAVSGTPTNTVTPFPADPLDRAHFVINSSGNFQLRHSFSVNIPVSGDPRLCRHWQNVKATFTYAGATRDHRERKPAVRGVAYHLTEPPLAEGRPCGFSDPYCVDGYLYVPDTGNTIHGGKSIIFLDTPGYPSMVPGMFYDSALNPVGVGIDATFQGHCRGTDASATTDSSYSFSAHVDASGNPTGPTFTP